MDFSITPSKNKIKVKNFRYKKILNNFFRLFSTQISKIIIGSSITPSKNRIKVKNFRYKKYLIIFFRLFST